MLHEQNHRLRSLLFKSKHCHQLLARIRGIPDSAEEMQKSKLYNSLWYYSAELAPGLIKRGIYPDTLPMLPRMLLRNCDLTGADCLDIGSVEGLIPILMRKQGARSVMATDHSFIYYQNLFALKAIHRVQFAFSCVGTLYDLSTKLSTGRHRGFDLINVSGVLYHVLSPLHVLAGVRPLLKQDGLMIVSTNVVNRADYSLEFNNSGKLQKEITTYWYFAVPAFDYILRYFQLMPIDSLYYKHPPDLRIRYGDLETGYSVPGLETGYLAVVCRAISDRGAQFGDEWLSESIARSLEYPKLCDQEMLESQPRSAITYRTDNGPISLREKLSASIPIERARHLHDSHLLKLDDTV